MDADQFGRLYFPKLERISDKYQCSQRIIDIGSGKNRFYYRLSAIRTLRNTNDSSLTQGINFFRAHKMNLAKKELTLLWQFLFGDIFHFIIIL